MALPETPPKKHPLFPDSWIIGQDAAALAHNDEQVLLAADVVPAKASPSRRGHVPAGPPTAAELADLHHEMARLQQRVATAPTRLRPQDRKMAEIGAELTAVRDRQVAPEGAFNADRGWIGPTRAGVQRRSMRGFSAALVLLVVLAMAGAWLTQSELARREGPLSERLDGLSVQMSDAMSLLAERLGGQFAALADRLVRFAGRVDERWQMLSRQADTGTAVGRRLDTLDASPTALHRQVDTLAGRGARPELSAATIAAVRARISPPQWWREQASARYTIQLVSVHRETDIYRFVQQHRDLPGGSLGIIRTQPDGAEMFSLVHGSYASLGGAQAALSALAPGIQANHPWVRPLAEISGDFLWQSEGAGAPTGGGSAIR